MEKEPRRQPKPKIEYEQPHVPPSADDVPFDPTAQRKWEEDRGIRPKTEKPIGDEEDGRIQDDTIPLRRDDTGAGKGKVDFYL